MEESADGRSLSVHGLDQVACAQMVCFVKLRSPQSLGAASAMDDVGDAGGSVKKALEVVDRAQAHLRSGQAMIEKAGGAGASEQDYCFQFVLAQVVQDVAAHKTAGACEQDLQSDQVQLFANHAEFV